MLRETEEKEVGETARETDILYHQDATVRWIFLYRGFWQLAFMVFFVVAMAYLFFKSRPPVPTPFVGSLIDLLDLKSRWVIPDLLETGYMFFVLSALFILSLTYLLYQLFYSAVLSEIKEEKIIDEVIMEEAPDGKEPEEGERIKVEHYFKRYFKLQPIGLLPTPINLQKNIWRRLFWYGTFLLFAIMLLSNVVLFTYFFRLLRNPEMDLSSGFFSSIYLVAIISRLLCLFLSVSTILQFAYHDFAVRVGKFTADFLPYFYPTIISVGIIAFVFSKLAQFDAFFIELVQSPGNLLLFTLFLFPVSLTIIWYGPMYSFFTDQKFAHRADSWNVAETHLRNKTSYISRLGIFGWLFLHERLYGVKPANVKPLPPPKYYMPLQNAKIPPPTITFFSVGRFLGVFYVFSLISICTGIYLGNNSALAPFSTFVPLFTLGLVLIYWVYIQKSFSRARHPNNLANRTVSKNKKFKFKPWQWWYNLRDREADKPKDTRVYYVDRKWTFWLGLVTVGFSLLFFLLTLWKSIAGAAWQVTFGYFLSFLLVSIFSFVWLVMYGGFYDRYTFDAKLRKSESGEVSSEHAACEVKPGKVSGWDRGLDLLGYSSMQAMLIVIWLVAGGFLLFFFYGMFSGEFLSSAFLQNLNPLNIYLLLINGFIALLLIIGRFLLLRDLSLQYAFYSDPKNKEEKYDTISVKNFFRGVAVVALVLALAYYGNSYHEVSYRAEMKEDGKVSLVDYTTTFLDRLEEKPGDREPILLVAADGGGLKACYWTMLQLYHLDSMGLFDDNVYLLSGASGGNMGLSMYTYLKGQQKPLPEIRTAIDKIGNTNFLSGDFTGLVARFPVNFVPNLPGWGARDLEDRAEAMARAYFNIVGGKTGPYSYEEIRVKPYAHLWQTVDYDLPLFISNTTRAEDGMRGIIHPLSNTDLAPGMVDLTARGNEAISFPDAAFLANRFPIMSPAGRIEGRGHFVDAGNSDNSGISTIMHVLNYLKANAAVPSQPGDTVYQRFFEDHPIIMIGVRNDINRFVRDQFITQKDALNRNFYRSELSANSNAAINSGVAGVPNSWDDYLRSDVPKKLGLVDEYHVIDLPFRLNETDVHLALGGELDDRMISQKVADINGRVDTALGCAEGEGCFAVPPPLGRLMARPSVEYMRLMVRYRDNWKVFERLGAD